MKLSTNLLLLLLSSLFSCLVSATSTINPLWAKSVTAGPECSKFSSINRDQAGNVYAVGAICNGTYDFGNGVTVTNISGSNNIVLVKYDANGKTLWAKSIVAGNKTVSGFNSIAIDQNGNSTYAAGYINGGDDRDSSISYDFGNNVTLATTVTGCNIVLTKYDANGKAQWAKSVIDGGDSSFSAVATDSKGNIYVVGHISWSNTYDFGNGVKIAGPNVPTNILLIKYNSYGDAQWAKSVISAPNKSSFSSAAVDSEGNIYVVGIIYGNEYNKFYDFGNNVKIIGTLSNTNNAVLIKYDSYGNTQWVKSIAATSGCNESTFSSITIDTSGNIYVAGNLFGGSDCTYDFGNNVKLAQPFPCRGTVLAKYDRNGQALDVKGVTATLVIDNSVYSTCWSELNSVTTSSDNVYASGFAYGSCKYDFGDGVIVNATTSLPQSSSCPKALLVEYNKNGKTLGATSAAGTYSTLSSVITDQKGNNTYVSGSIVGSDKYDFGNGVTVAGTASGTNANPVLVKYRN